MKKYLFLLSWVAGTNGACGDDTKVNSSEDLLPEYKNGNGNVFAILIVSGGLTSEHLIESCGYREAFFANYTGEDTVSEVVEIESDFVHPYSSNLIQELIQVP